MRIERGLCSSSGCLECPRRRGGRLICSFEDMVGVESFFPGGRIRCWLGRVWIQVWKELFEARFDFGFGFFWGSRRHLGMLGWFVCFGCFLALGWNLTFRNGIRFVVQREGTTLFTCWLVDCLFTCWLCSFLENEPLTNPCLPFSQARLGLVDWKLTRGESRGTQFPSSAQTKVLAHSRA